ncbi:MAG: serine protease [bacterium]|nr:serine protease [bacterium]
MFKTAKFITFVLFCTLFISLSPAQSEESLRRSNRIVGGSESTVGNWPFIAALYSSGYSLEQGQFCGGTLIAPTWVVTAAHCLQGETADSIMVALGVHNLANDVGERLQALRIIIHPSYDASTVDNDIALIELRTASAQIPAAIYQGSSDLTGQTATAIGWGNTSGTNNNSSSVVLRDVDLPIISNSTCAAAYGGGQITSNMLCAGYAQGGYDSCQGDSGGPLVLDISGTTTLGGIVSWGTGCGDAGYYGVYTRINQFISFISQYISLDSGTPPFIPPSPTIPLPTSGQSSWGLWNGYLDMVNILELENNTSSSVSSDIYLVRPDGVVGEKKRVTVSAKSKQDVILNDMYGFEGDVYGLIKIAGELEGRITYYRPTGGSFDNFEYAFSVDTTAGETVSTWVGFNTYQPSSNPDELGNLVANWLTIANLSSSSKSFTVKKYDQSGALLAQEGLTLAAWERRDIDGGHVTPGPSNVGLIQVVPQSASPYIAELMRYGYSSNGGLDFAFPLNSHSGETSEFSVPLSTTASAQNWLEIANISSSASQVSLKIRDASGTIASQSTINLAAREQQHININTILGDGAIGRAFITPLSGKNTLANSMHYFRNSTSGSILSMYGAEGRTASSGTTLGSYNLFLNMYSFLKLGNTSSQATTYRLRVTSPLVAGTTTEYISVPAYGSVDVNISEGRFSQAQANTYGVVEILPYTGGADYSADMLRLRFDNNGLLQFAAPSMAK